MKTLHILSLANVTVDGPVAMSPSDHATWLLGNRDLLWGDRSVCLTLACEIVGSNPARALLS